MFRFSEKKIKKQVNALENRLIKQFGATWQQMSLWQRIWEKKFIFGYFEEKKLFYLFINSFLILKNKLPYFKKNNLIIEENFFFSYFLNAKQKISRNSELLFQNIKAKAEETKNKNIKNLFRNQNLSWTNKKTILKKKIDEIDISVLKTDKIVVLANFCVFLLTKQFKNKMKQNQIQKKAYEFGFSLGMYISAHYELWKNHYQEILKLKKRMKSKQKSNLFFIKLLFGKIYAEQLQFFFPLDFNSFVRQINRSLGV